MRGSESLVETRDNHLSRCNSKFSRIISGQGDKETSFKAAWGFCYFHYPHLIHGEGFSSGGFWVFPLVSRVNPKPPEMFVFVSEKGILVY